MVSSDPFLFSRPCLCAGGWRGIPSARKGALVAGQIPQLEHNATSEPAAISVAITNRTPPTAVGDR